MRMYIILKYNRRISNIVKIKISTNKSLYRLNYDIPLQKMMIIMIINFMVRKDGLSDIEINKKLFLTLGL